MMKKLRYIIGIDEVGRGALAGPVTVAAVAIMVNPKPIFARGKSPEGLIRDPKPRLKLRDSKKLTPRQRETWFGYIKTHPGIFYTTAGVSPKIIDKINISNAANLAATRALDKLTKNLKLKAESCKIFLDGGLYLLKSLNSRTIIKGDEKVPAIMLASIVAKVSRDRLMKKLHGKRPQYDFINNVGYGTKKHLRTIKKYGRLPIHRKSFRIK